MLPSPLRERNRFVQLPPISGFDGAGTRNRANWGELVSRVVRSRFAEHLHDTGFVFQQDTQELRAVGWHGVCYRQIRQGFPRNSFQHIHAAPGSTEKSGSRRQIDQVQTEWMRL